jgi:RNA polymerase sigma-70 factor (ECF subfamily)
VQARDAGREVSLHRGHRPETSSAALADLLLGHDPRPSEAAVRAERKLQLEQALSRMDSIDREVLALRHFEHLNRAETAQVLGIQEAAVSKRYIRALKRLKDILSELPGGLEGFLP